MVPPIEKLDRGGGTHELLARGIAAMARQHWFS
jgi:hypothetical protein